MANKQALIAGATGLVGKELIKLLVKSDYYKKITVFCRTPHKYNDDRIETIVLEDFSQLDKYEDHFDVNHVYCLVGTTMKKAKTKDAFKKVDHDIPIGMAKLAKSKPNFEQFLIVTSLGASSSSPIFYNQVKGMVEDDLQDLDLPGLKVFRPSLLQGHRDERRIWEQIAKVVSQILSFFVVGSKRKIWTVKAAEVAEAMFRIAKVGKKGNKVYKPKKIFKIVYS